MAKYREHVAYQPGGSGLPCCEGWPGYCPEHADFLAYERLTWYLGRSRADSDAG
jgi:hypothetical protein